MKSIRTALSFNGTDLTVPHQSWDIVLISVLGLCLETPFIRWGGRHLQSITGESTQQFMEDTHLPQLALRL
jgi:hypothetical protein